MTVRDACVFCGKMKPVVWSFCKDRNCPRNNFFEIPLSSEQQCAVDAYWARKDGVVRRARVKAKPRLAGWRRNRRVMAARQADRVALMNARWNRESWDVAIASVSEEIRELVEDQKHDDRERVSKAKGTPWNPVALDAWLGPHDDRTAIDVLFVGSEDPTAEEALALIEVETRLLAL